MTTIVIAHRLSTVREADCIYVLNKGVLTESGNHDELLRKGGLYAELVQSQLAAEKHFKVEQKVENVEKETEAEVAEKVVEEKKPE